MRATQHDNRPTVAAGRWPARASGRADRRGSQLGRGSPTASCQAAHACVAHSIPACRRPGSAHRTGAHTQADAPITEAGAGRQRETAVRTSSDSCCCMCSGISPSIVPTILMVSFEPSIMPRASSEWPTSSKSAVASFPVASGSRDARRSEQASGSSSPHL